MKKAILIDVNNKTITEVTVTKDNDGSELQSMYQHIGCNMVEVVNIGQDDIYVDEEGLLSMNEDSKFFMWNGYPQPLVGNGLVIGFDSDSGDSTDVNRTLEEVKEKVKFLSYREVAMGSLLNQW